MSTTRQNKFLISAFLFLFSFSLQHFYIDQTREQDVEWMNVYAIYALTFVAYAGIGYTLRSSNTIVSIMIWSIVAVIFVIHIYNVHRQILDQPTDEMTNIVQKSLWIVLFAIIGRKRDIVSQVLIFSLVMMFVGSQYLFEQNRDVYPAIIVMVGSWIVLANELFL